MTSPVSSARRKRSMRPRSLRVGRCQSASSDTARRSGSIRWGGSTWWRSRSLSTVKSWESQPADRQSGRSSPWVLPSNSQNLRSEPADRRIPRGVGPIEATRARNQPHQRHGRANVSGSIGYVFADRQHRLPRLLLSVGSAEPPSIHDERRSYKVLKHIIISAFVAVAAMLPAAAAHAGGVTGPAITSTARCSEPSVRRRTSPVRKPRSTRSIRSTNSVAPR